MDSDTIREVLTMLVEGEVDTAIVFLRDRLDEVVDAESYEEQLELELEEDYS